MSSRHIPYDKILARLRHHFRVMGEKQGDLLTPVGSRYLTPLASVKDITNLEFYDLSKCSFVRDSHINEKFNYGTYGSLKSLNYLVFIKYSETTRIRDESIVFNLDLDVRRSYNTGNKNVCLGLYGSVTVDGELDSVLSLKLFNDLVIDNKESEG